MNPVLWKDLLAHARSPGGSGLRLAAGVVPFAAALLIFAWCVTVLPGAWRHATSMVFLGVAALMALAGLSVGVPAATAFALERDRDTLEGLVISPLRPWRLVLGKLGAAVAVGFVLHASLLPLLAMAYALGGGELLFVPAWMLLLTATSASFGSFCLAVGARRLEAGGRIGWMKAQTSQSQLALQSSLGLAALLSIGPIYAALFLPVLAASGAPVARWLEPCAALGACHPLTALMVWGDATVLGLRLPVWLVGTVFHLVLTLPLLADAVEAQRCEGAPPGRASRALTLPALAFIMALVASTAQGLPAPFPAILGIVAPALALLVVAARTAYVPAESVPRVTLRRLLGGLRPDLALESAPDRAPGFVLLVALVVAPLVLWAVPSRETALWVLGSLTLVSVALAALGARLVALQQERDDRALIEAVEATSKRERALNAPRVLTGEGQVGPAAATEDAPASEGKSSLRARFFARLLLASLILPCVAGAGLSFGKSAVPALAPLRPLFEGMAAIGVALNPLCGVLPALADPAVIGTDAVAKLFAAAGVNPKAVVLGHLGIYLVALLLSVITLRPPLDPSVLVAALPPPDEPEPTGAAEAHGFIPPDLDESGDYPPVPDRLAPVANPDAPAPAGSSAPAVVQAPEPPQT